MVSNHDIEDSEGTLSGVKHSFRSGGLIVAHQNAERWKDAARNGRGGCVGNIPKSMARWWISSLTPHVAGIADAKLVVSAKRTVKYSVPSSMFAVGAELSDWQSGDFHIIREYMKPIPR